MSLGRKSTPPPHCESDHGQRAHKRGEEEQGNEDRLYLCGSARVFGRLTVHAQTDLKPEP